MEKAHIAALCAAIVLGGCATQPPERSAVHTGADARRAVTDLVEDGVLKLSGNSATVILDDGRVIQFNARDGGILETMVFVPPNR